MYHRLRIAASTATRILGDTSAACEALLQHIDACAECKDRDNFCEEAQRLNEARKAARLRSRVLGLSDEEPGIEA